VAKFEKTDKKFLNYNKRNILINLLQAEQHARDMQTLNFIKGEGSCYLKHLLFVKGEIEEAINACTNLKLKKEIKVFEKLKRELEKFIDRIESNKHNYHKIDLINLVRRWRKEVEKTIPYYQTFNCKCLHSIPYIKTLLYFLAGFIFAYLIKLIGMWG
jgi:hypothetical protein